MIRRMAIVVLVLVALNVVAEERRKVGRAVITFYWIIDESSSKYKGKRDSVLRDMRGNIIAHTTYRFKRELVMEGTGYLRDGRTIMFEARKNGESRFRITNTKYGLTSTGCPLVPYRTIAVDGRFVKHGATIYIPQLKGAKLPDGTIHDGVFIAADRGHFRGAHVDIFTGVGPRASRPFSRRGYPSRSHVTVYVDDDAKRDDCKM
jgi:3D (Asp-Asp-Asp) domain-containing protein